jgi:hypothetical protein
MASAGTAELLPRAKGMWNELRERTTPRPRKRELVHKLVGLLKGHFREVVMKHDASRIVQSIVRFGTPAEQLMVVNEFCKEGILMELTKAKYGHQLVCKLLRWGSPDVRTVVFKQLQGHMGRLATHAQGAVVVETGWMRGFSGAQKWELEQELLGSAVKHEMSTVKGGGRMRSLADLIKRNAKEAMTAEAPIKFRQQVVTAATAVLQRAADKALLGVTVLHRLAEDAFVAARDVLPGQAVALVPLLREAVVAMAGSRDGGRAVCFCLGYGGAKDRKVMCKRLAEHALELAKHEVGALVLARAMQVTDDTKMVASTLLKPLGLAEPVKVRRVAELARDHHGRKVLLQLLQPVGSWLSPDEVRVMEEYKVPVKPKAVPVSAEAEAASKKAGAEAAVAAFDAVASPSSSAAAAAAATAAASSSTAVELVATSKKQPERRAAELLASAGRAIADTCTVEAGRLMIHASGSEVLTEAVWKLGVQGTSEGALLDSVAQACLAIAPEGADEEDEDDDDDGDDDGEEEEVAAEAAATSSSSSAAAAAASTEAGEGEDDDAEDADEDEDDEEDKATTASSAAEEAEEEVEEPLPETAQAMLEHPKTALFIKRTLLAEKKSPELVKSSFAAALLAAMKAVPDSQAAVAALATNRGAFTLVTLCESPFAGEDAKKWVRSLSAVLKAAPASKGLAVLRKVIAN